MHQPSWSFNQSLFESTELLKNTCHELPVEASRADTDETNSLATERAEMTAFVGWYVHQAGLTDLRHVITRWVPHEGDVPLAPKHVDKLFQQSLLLSAPCLAVLKRFDNDAGVVSERVGELQLRMGHGRTCKWRSYANGSLNGRIVFPQRLTG